jgi:hypothetical protein
MEKTIGSILSNFTARFARVAENAEGKLFLLSVERTENKIHQPFGQNRLQFIF